MTHKASISAASRAAIVSCLTLIGSCAITSPYWGYVPASTSAPIPFQTWGFNTGTRYVECANDTGGHGNPAAGEASYIPVTTLYPTTQPSLDSQGGAIYSASKSVPLPSVCWKYFDYGEGYYQANVRVVTLDSAGKKSPLSSFDLAGLECLGRETGRAASWSAYLNKGCEMKYLGTTEQIPYIVLRIPAASQARAMVSSAGSAGSANAAVTPLATFAPKGALSPTLKVDGAQRVTPVYVPTAADITTFSTSRAVVR
ncbi:MAG: hypothetical protein RL385_3975 [Pseudomonadota bacterium]|jgi:hypothetical protein